MVGIFHEILISTMDTDALAQWLCASPGHQQPRHWLWVMVMFFCFHWIWLFIICDVSTGAKCERLIYQCEVWRTDISVRSVKDWYNSAKYEGLIYQCEVSRTDISPQVKSAYKELLFCCGNPMLHQNYALVWCFGLVRSGLVTVHIHILVFYTKYSVRDFIVPSI